MRKTSSAILMMVLSQLLILHIANAQLTALPNGGNKKAWIGERIGITDVSIHYDRPGIKGREGQIWGKLVAVGFADLGFGNTKQAPWRAGANENTTIEFSTDVKIEGKDLPAGKYAFFVAYDPNECTLIFSKNNSSWGSFYYDPREDILQVKVKPVPMDKNVEWLKYEFLNETENSATIGLEWEKLLIPFKVEVDYINTQLASFRRELRSDKAFTWEAWNQAAQWCIQKNTNLDQALLWADSATSDNFGGERSFAPWSTRAQLLDKLGRSAEALEIMNKALPLGDATEVHLYARQLLGQKKTKEAFDIFKMNYDKHPGEFVTTMGMARAYSAMGNYKKALEFAEKAQPLATDAPNKANIAKIISTLKEGKDIN
jgi:tetratricopeptide (TPR) repeat protein